jgi:GNAT superfamily N-acetyltransferase
MEVRTSLQVFTPESADLEQFCALAGLGELTPNMVRIHAPDALLICTSRGTVVARASLWWREVPKYPGHRVGLIGHYAAYEVAEAEMLLTMACEELAQKGCTLAVGPLDGSTWRRYRLLSERGTAPLFFLEPDNPDDWPGHFLAADFLPLARYHSTLREGLAQISTGSPKCRIDVRMRTLDLTRIDAELPALWRFSEAAFADNLLYSPISEEEFESIYRRLLPLIRPEWVLLAEHRGELVGLCLAVPDLLQAQRGESLDTVVFKTLAVAPEVRGAGLGAMLVEEVGRRALSQGVHRAIHALMLEDNYSMRIDGSVTRPLRTYTLYARKI